MYPASPATMKFSFWNSFIESSAVPIEVVNDVWNETFVLTDCTKNSENNVIVAAEAYLSYLP